MKSTRQQSMHIFARKLKCCTKKKNAGITTSQYKLQVWRTASLERFQNFELSIQQHPTPRVTQKDLQQTAKDFFIVIKNNEVSPATATSEQSLSNSYFFRPTKYFSVTVMKFKRGVQSTAAQHSMYEELVVAQQVLVIKDRVGNSNYKFLPSSKSVETFQ